MANFELYNGDCLELMERIPDKSVDLVLCDPPYGTTHCEWDKPIDLVGMWGGVSQDMQAKCGYNPVFCTAFYNRPYQQQQERISL